MRMVYTTKQAGLEDLRTRYRRTAVTQYERWRSLEEGGPRRSTIEREVRREGLAKQEHPRTYLGWSPGDRGESRRRPTAVERG